MKRVANLALLLSVLAAVRAAGQSAGPEARSRFPEGLTEWQPSSLVPGVSYMPLLGDRDKPGPFVYRVRAAHGVRIPPHWHSKTMHLTVLSGTLMMVMTESADSNRARPYAAGSFLVTPAGMRHTEWFEGETVVHVETEGPLETVFVDPGDDPRNRGWP